MSYLRPYQEQASDAIIDAINRVRSTLIVMPTGTGKTETVLHTIQRFMADNPDSHVLGLAHRQELVMQPYDRWQTKTGEVPNMEMGEFRRSMLVGSSKLTFASKDSLHPKRLREAFPDPKEVGLLWCDEAHRVTKKSSSWWHVIDYFMSGNPDCRLIGSTATPDRQDEISLGQIFDDVSFDYPLMSTDGSPSAIGDGWLVPIKQEYVTLSGVKFESIGSTKGDFIDSQLEKALLDDKPLYKIVEGTRAVAGDKTTLCFTSGIEQAIRQAMLFNSSSPGSARAIASSVPTHLAADFVCNSRDGDARREFIEDWKKNYFQYCTNAMIFTEGFDFPGIGVVSMGRPTKSRALYVQMLGRGTRILPNIIEGRTPSGTWRVDDPVKRKALIAMSAKPYVSVLDFVGVSNLELVSALDVLGGKECDEVIAKARTYQKRGTKDVVEAIKKAKSDIEDELEKRKRIRARFETIHREELTAMNVIGAVPTREPGWHKGRKPTPKMREALRKFKLEDAEINKMSFWEATTTMDRLVSRAKEGLCTFKQAKILAKYGERTDLTFQQASSVIDRIAKNKWKAFDTPVSQSMVGAK